MERSAIPRLTWLTLVCMVVMVGDAVGVASANDEPTTRDTSTVHFLAIGNSFSRNATDFLMHMADAGDQKLVVGHAAMGSGSLAQHWEKVERHEADPDDPKGRYPSGKSLVEMLEAHPWDYISVQQYSFHSHDPATYQPAGDKLAAFIRSHAPDAQLLVHQTWAHRVDDPKFKPGQQPEGRPRDRTTMYEQLTSAYEQFAEAIDARLVPVGDAFHRADSDPLWGFQPTEVDSAAFTHPDLPEQTHSLHVGYVWRPRGEDNEPRLIFDGHHASIAGRYLGACVFYEVLFGESAVGHPFIPEQLTPDYARFLQQTAHDAVKARQP